MKVNIREVERILEENLRKYESGEKPANIYFLCRHDLYLDHLILDWFKKHKLDSILNMLPQVLWEENKYGILEKTNPPVYVFSNEMQKRMDKPFVFYYKMLNYGRDCAADDMVIDLISKEIAPNASFEPLDLKNRMFTVAYGFTKESGNRVQELSKYLTGLFDVYEVEEDLQYMLEDKYQSLISFADALKEDGNKNSDKYYLHASFVKKLIETGYNIQDCGVYLNNNLEKAFDFGDNNTFESYKAGLIKSLEEELKPGVFVITEKAKEDVPMLIDWIKNTK